MKRCKCGNNYNFVSNASKNSDASIYDSGNPDGPFTSTKCGEEYNELTDLPELRYRCYEEGYVGEYTKEGLVDLYEKVVNKKEYPDYESWYADMIKLSIFIKENPG